MLRQRSTPAAEACVIGLLVLICLGSGIGLSPILNGDEARFAQASREMFLNQEWVVPTFAGQPRYDKPILIYWATAASFRVFGVSPWAARLPSAIAAALCASLLAWSARRRWGSGSGLAAGLFLAASPIFFFEGRTCTADALNLLWTMVAMLTMEKLLIGRPTRWTAAVFWAATGLAVLTKGPVAPLFIGSTLCGLWAFERHWKPWEAAFATILMTAGAVTVGPILLIIPAVAALVSMLARTSHQLSTAVVDAQRPEALSHLGVLNVTSSTPPRPSDRKLHWAQHLNDLATKPGEKCGLGRTEIRHRIATFQWPLGILVFLLVTLPWAIAAWRATSGEFFRVAIGRHVIERGQAALEGHSGFPGFYMVTAVILCFPWLAFAVKAGTTAWRQRRNTPDQLFLLAWALGPLVTLELVQTKLVHYWLPSYPALILLAVGWLWTTGDRSLPRGLVLLHLLGGSLLAAIPIIPAHIFDLPGLKLPAFMLSCLLLVATLFIISTRQHRIWASVAGTLLFLSLLFGPFLSRFSDSFIGSQTTEAAMGQLRQGNLVALYGLRDEEMLFSLPLETQVYRTPEKLGSELIEERNTVFCAREKDFHRTFGTLDSDRFEVIQRIEGLDLGRGRHTTTVFFRSREDR